MELEWEIVCGGGRGCGYLVGSSAPVPACMSPSSCPDRGWR